MIDIETIFAQLFFDVLSIIKVYGMTLVRRYIDLGMGVGRGTVPPLDFHIWYQGRRQKNFQERGNQKKTEK